MENKINVFMPKSYDLVVGDTFQLFYRGIIEAVNPYNYSIVATCEKGKHFPRYFEFTPNEVGKYNLNVSVFDDNFNLLDSADTILNVVKPSPAKKPLNILVLGDSLTGGGQWVNEVYRRITASDGEPQGLGYNNIKFVGKVHKGEVDFQATGGWYWKNFSNTVSDSLTMEAFDNKKTVEDQHSIWRAENGGLWQLESFEKDYLRFNKYKEHNCPNPEPGYLYHESNAVNQEPIKFTSCWTPAASPFLNKETGKIDFANYLKELGLKPSDLDVVYACLGANGTNRQVALNNTIEYYCENVVTAEAKEIIDMILDVCPNVKIKLLSYPIQSLRGGMGSNYGAISPSNDSLRKIHFNMVLGKTYKNLVEEEKYKNNLEYINISGQFDSEYGYPHVFKPVNTRSKEVEWFDINGVHPSNDGYMQIADAVFRNLVKECFSEKE